jgi:hypothetical protein
MTDISDLSEMKPRITVFGVGGAGGNAVNNMITAGLEGVEFVVANTDAQALTMSKAARTIQMGIQVTQGLGASAASHPSVLIFWDHFMRNWWNYVSNGTLRAAITDRHSPINARVESPASARRLTPTQVPFLVAALRRPSLSAARISSHQIRTIETW